MEAGPGAVVPARARFLHCGDRFADIDHCPHRHCPHHRFQAAAPRLAVADHNYTSAGYRPGERHDTGRRGRDDGTSGCHDVDTPVPGAVAVLWSLEGAEHDAGQRWPPVGRVPDRRGCIGAGFWWCGRRQRAERDQ